MEMKIEIEMVELEGVLEKPWKTVNNNKKKKLRRRPWDALPSLALFNIIRNLNFKDRFGSIPLVCKAWNSVITIDPRVWSSMIPESISPDDAFIKKPVYSVQVDLPSKLFYHRDRPVPIGGKSDDPNICPGVSYLRTFIKKSSTGEGGSSSTITSLYLDPFSFSYPNNESVDHDQILHLIAHCCPNLKHISFDGFYCASIEAVLEVFHSCKKIELINFSDSGYADSVQVIEELGKCLPNLRGIRMEGWKNYSIHDAIATHLPRIKLLAMDCRSYEAEGDLRKLTSETECCLYELQYLNVAVYRRIDPPPPVCTHIPEFHYEELHQYDWDDCVNCHPLRPVPVHRLRFGYRRLCYSCFSRLQREEADKDYLKCLHDEEEDRKYSILKEKKKRRRHHHQYYVVLRTRMKRNKKKEEASFILKMKMRKKRDTYDYQDFYVRAAF